MVIRREEQTDGGVVGQAGKLVREGGGEENTKKRVVRQAEEDGREAGPFDLFGQVINSFGGLLGQLASVGGEFISDQQRLNEPVHEELGNIGGTISRSSFVQGATNGVSEVPKLIGTKTSLVTSTIAMKINLLQSLACIFLPQQCPTNP